MASSSFSDAPNPETSEAEAKSVTIVINDNGEINYDEKTLQSIIDSNQPSATVTFVRVSGAGNDAEAVGTPPADTVPEDPILMLDQDQITKLENVLRSEEAKDFLDEVLSNPGTNPNESLGDFLTPTTAETVGPPPPLIPNDEVKEQLQQENDQTKSKSNRRKSQRQLDRELKEEAEKIRKENQKMLKKEKEAMRRQSRGEGDVTPPEQEEEKSESNDTPPPTPTVASTRPRRERKLPAHLKAGDFEYSYKGINETKKKSTPAKEFKPEEEAQVLVGDLKETMEEKDESKADVTMDSEDEDSDEDMNSEDADSEDDPHKLWCICQQPHNNRFMICCDNCLDWFHGKCVGITKKMGKEMEEAGNEWTCPKCKNEVEKEVTEKQNAELKDKLKERETSISTSKKKSSATPKANKDNAPSENQKKEVVKKKTCFLCSKDPIEESIYCSDECIIKHAKKAVELLRKNKPKSSTSLTKTKSPVLVIEPQTNHMINGPNAPTEESLETWLLSHPTYHAVLPSSDPSSKYYGSSTAKFYGNKNKDKKQEKVTPPKISSAKIKAALEKEIPKPAVAATPKVVKTPEVIKPARKSIETKPERKSLEQASVVKKVESSEKVRKPSGSPTKAIVVHSTSSSHHKYHRRDSSSSHSRKDKHHSSSSHSSSPSGSSSASGSKDSKESKAIRETRDNITKGIRNALKSKLEKNEDVKIDDSKLDDLVKIIEYEMYRYYSKDVGNKYKAKYRSLVFNIKDEKNNGLFRKIINGNIAPKKLVAMSAEDMANNELKQWRQAEIKHDIEKIKSHELELLQTGAKIIMKTHKGDEVREDPKKNEVQAVLPDDLVHVQDAKEDEYKDKADDRKEDRKDKDRKKSKKSSDRDRDSERKRDRDRDSDRKKDRDRDRDRDKDRDRKRDRDRKKEKSEEKSEVKTEVKIEVKPEDIEKKVQEILASSGALDMKQIETSAEAVKEPEMPDLPEPIDIDIPALRETKMKEESEEVSEVTSTVTIKTPEEPLTSTNPVVWSGQINMPDVANFSVTAHQVSGTTDYLTYDLKETLKIVGRIPPKTVWDYVKQVSESKEILLINLLPKTKDEQMNYSSFFKYLNKRDRFGVIGNNGKMVKDCYIIALPKTEAIHSCLLPLDGPGLDEDRNDVLLALIVRSKRKRAHVGTPVSSSAKRSKKSPVTLDDDDIKDMLDESEMKSNAYIPTPVSDQDKPYDPALAGGLVDMHSSSTSPDDNEIYDPESAFEPKKKRPKKLASSYDPENDDPQFSDDESPSPPPPKGPITSSGGGFTDKLAILSKKIEDQKKELSNIAKTRKLEIESKAPKVEGFQGLPSAISSILFGSTTASASTSSSTASSTIPKEQPDSTRRDPRKKPVSIAPPSKLATMSDADLIKAAEAMETPPVTVAKSVRKDSGIPPLKKDSGIPSLHKDSGIPTLQKGSGIPAVPSLEHSSTPPVKVDSGIPPPPSLSKDKSGPWMQGFEPNQPNLPWPSRGSGKESYRGRHDDRRGQDRDRGGHDRDRHDRRRDSRDRDYRDRRDHQDHHRDRKDSKDYHRRDSRDRDRRYSRDSYDRRRSGSDRDHDRHSSRDRDRSRDRSRDQDQRKSTSSSEILLPSEEPKVEQPKPGWKPIEEVAPADLEQPKDSSAFFSLFATDEPKPPGEDDVVPF